MNKTIMVIILGLIFAITSIMGYVDYNYQIEKCNNMKDSNYDFDLKLEINAEYANNCYYIQNHPIAFFERVFGISLTIVFSVLFFFWFNKKIGF